MLHLQFFFFFFCFFFFGEGGVGVVVVEGGMVDISDFFLVWLI